MKQKLLKCLGKAIPMLIITMLLGSAAFAQKNVSGKVTGPDGKAVGGATVSVKGTAVATSSSADGSYIIAVPAGGPRHGATRAGDLPRHDVADAPAYLPVHLERCLRRPPAVSTCATFRPAGNRRR